MRQFGAALLLTLQLGLSALAGASFQWPLQNDGQTDLVEWDHYSFKINGERMFVWSGEWHYWRIPVPEMWTDILEKVKAAGFNTVSLYSHWGYHAASPGVVDFETGSHNVVPIFEMCKALGLYVIWRPGPYINAETTAGGFPGWVTTGAYGSLRNNDSRYTEAWGPYFDGISKIVSEHSITKGGNVIFYQIENEYGEQWLGDPSNRTPNETAIAYMELLEAAAKNNGIDMPTTHNNPNLYTKSWSMDYDINHVGGDVWLYGADSYPSCWSCNLEECASSDAGIPDFTVLDYFTNFQQTAPGDPSFLTEFQGGAYNPWNGPAGGCVSNTGPDWVNVFYRNNIAQKVAAQNIYMVFGGTNWGGLPFPTVGTSYDYSAPVQENRMLESKYSETKLMSLVVRNAKDLTMVERVTNGTNYTTNANVFTQILRNVDNDARFYVTHHANTTLETVVNFKQNVTTSVGNFMIPQYAADVELNGRQSKILVSDYNAGPQKIIYSSAEVLAVSVQNNKAVMVFWVPTGESGEFYLEGSKHGSIKSCNGCSNVAFHTTAHGIITGFTQGTGMSVIQYDNGATAVLLDRTTAYQFWQPALTNDPHVPLDQTALVVGPYLIRSASISHDTIALTGDYNGTTTIDVIAAGVNKVTFNGAAVSVHFTSYGSLKGTLAPAKYTVASINSTLPVLSSWKVAGGFPEKEADYDDSRWVDANHDSTPSFNPPATYPVLYADDYGYHTGVILWRGRFSGNTSGVFLNVIGGTGSGWSAYLNGKFLGSTFGDVTLPETNLTLAFGDALVAGENVLFVAQDQMGKDETTGALNPRGILNATLLGGLNFTSWKVQGNAGGQANIDPIRGTYSEGGLHAERLGWHLPGFDDSAWASGTPEEGVSTADAVFYRTIVPLDMPVGYDVSLAFELGAANASEIRAQLYVNGYMFAKFIPCIGNQVEFPVPPGILDYHGDNTIGLSLWAQGADGAGMSVSMSVLGVYASDFDVGFDSSYLRPGWSPSRLQYY